MQTDRSFVVGLCEVVLTRIDRVEDPTRVGERCKSESRYVFSFRRASPKPEVKEPPWPTGR